MPTVDLSKYTYYPSMTSSPPELIAYENLSARDKKSLLPAFELSYRRNASSVMEIIQSVRKATGTDFFILDINQNPAPEPILSKNPTQAEQDKYDEQIGKRSAYNNDLSRLLDPTNGFASWRECAAVSPNAVPMIIYTDAATQHKNILKQAAFFSRRGTSMAIRMRPDSYVALMPVVSQILSILESEDQLLILLDCGQVRQRGRRSRGIKFIRDAASGVLNDIDPSRQGRVRMVSLSNSFPQLKHGGVEPFASYDWEVWRTAKDVHPMMFGDYAAQFRLPPSAYIPTGKSTVVFPLDEKWIAYRDPNAGDPQGWITGSRLIMSHESYDPAISSWGHNLIKSAAQGDITGVEFARYWHAAKINLHIHRQIHLAATNIAGHGGGPDD